MAVCTKCGQTTDGALYDFRRMVALSVELGGAMVLMDHIMGRIGFRGIIQDKHPRYSEDRGPVPFWDGAVDRTPDGWTYFFALPDLHNRYHGYHR